MNIEEKINDFLINASFGEVLNYKRSEKRPVVESYEKNQWSYIVEIMILTVKSLSPSREKGGNIIDYSRFQNELSLWLQYRHGFNKSLVSSIRNDSIDYIREKDESIYARISVIVFANQDWNIIKEEVVKNALYSTINPEIILESLMLSRLLFLVISDDLIEYEKVLEDLRNEVIKFSQEELEVLDKKSEVSSLLREKRYKIDFERKRILLIGLLNGMTSIGEFSVLSESLEILESRETINSSKDRQTDDSYNFFLTGLRGINSGELISTDIKDLSFLKDLCAYIVRLRKGRIDLRDLSLRKVNSQGSVFDYELGMNFSHPLLNSAKVIYKELRGDYMVSYIETRAGIYRFVKINKN